MDQETGFLFESDDEFVSKAQAFIESSHDEKDQIKKNALAKSLDFDSQAFGQRVFELYERAIDIYYGKYILEAVEQNNEDVLIRVASNNDSEEFYIEGFLAERRDLEVGREMSRNEINEIKDDQKAYEGYQLALKRISIKDYSSYEMRAYLMKKKELNDDQIDVVIALLERRRFIDDERFLNERIDYLRSQNRGNYRILEDLLKRGFSEQEVDAKLMDEESDDYIDRGVLRAEHFLKSQNKGSKRQRDDRLKQHLVRQGYNFSDASKITRLASDHYTEENELESLKKLLTKSKERFERRYEGDEVKDRMIRQALSKGYNYDMIEKVMKEF